MIRNLEKFLVAQPSSRWRGGRVAGAAGWCVGRRFRGVTMRGTESYNLSESIRLTDFGHMRSYILIIRRDRYMICYILRDISYFFLIIGEAARRNT